MRDEGRKERRRRFAVRASAAAVLAATCLTFGAPAASQAPAGKGTSPAVSSFTLAVLRRDGVIIPVASYGFGGWASHWPAPGRRPDIPISVEDSPRNWWEDKTPVADWTAWPIDAPSRAIHVKSPVNLIVECQPQVGLQTDYQSAHPPEPPRIQPFPKDGLATAGSVRIEPISQLAAGSPEWLAVAGAVTSRVTSEEPRLLRREQLKTPIPDSLRASTPFTLEVLFATPDVKAGGTLLYFEGVKRYPPRTTLPSGLMTYAVGYARLGPKGPPEIELSATLSDRRREGLVYSFALGSFHMGERLFWVVQRSTWGYERFDVVEVRQDEILTIFKVPGGVCG